MTEGLRGRLDVTIALWMVLVARAKLARCVGAAEEKPASVGPLNRASLIRGGAEMG